MRLDNPAEERFAQEYVRTGNASEAWRLATGKIKNADVNGPPWLVKSGIASRIEEIRVQNDRKSEIKRDEAIGILCEIIKTPIGEVGRMHPLCQEYGYTPNEHGGAERFKMPAKLDALTRLGSWCGWDKGTEAENKAADSLAVAAGDIVARLTHGKPAKQS